MSDVINVRKSLSSLEKQDTFNGYSKVVVAVSDEMEYSAGTDSGRTLTLDCPWGTQKMAEDILSRIQGFQYQPYTADGAHIDPAAEIGDGFAAGNLYSGIYSKNISHGALYTANVSAPGGEKINYKYEYKTPTQRKIERHYSEMKSTFKVQADQISAEVSARIEQGDELTSRLDIQSDQISARVTKTGGSSSSFGWELLDDSWKVKANNTTVFQITKSGAEVRGKITALSGKLAALTSNPTTSAITIRSGTAPTAGVFTLVLTAFSAALRLTACRLRRPAICTLRMAISGEASAPEELTMAATMGTLTGQALPVTVSTARKSATTPYPRPIPAEVSIHRSGMRILQTVCSMGGIQRLVYQPKIKDW